MVGRNGVILLCAAALWTGLLVYTHHGQSLRDKAIRQWAAGFSGDETATGTPNLRARVLISPGDLDDILKRSETIRSAVHLLAWLLGMGIVGILWKVQGAGGSPGEKESVIAMLDEVTGLHNRRAFHGLVTPQLAAAEKQMDKALVMVVNLDDFDRIVGSYGKEEGHRSLRLVSEALMSSFRGTDIVARYGDDEFAAFLPNASRLFDERILERIQENVAARNRDIGGTYNLSVSIGIAEFDPLAPVALDKLIRSAFDVMIGAMGKGSVNRDS